MLNLDHLTAVPGVGLSPSLGTFETGQVLLAGMPGSFSQESAVYIPSFN